MSIREGKVNKNQIKKNKKLIGEIREVCYGRHY